ncbi:MAG: DUF3159 domain-containing protein [Actinomycetota bacterium]|nr:DUF3159 domain-containing protein [Actinomycetota bacterium]MDP2288762.1 DUF3159 domain-containing protein [Actinomycetota bacterium]
MSHEETAPSPSHETAADLRAESVLLERAIGGWRGIIDSGLPTIVFVVAYLVTNQNLGTSLAAALIAAGAIVLWRLVRHEPLQQIAAGFAGVLISAGFAKYTGRAENFYFIGMLTNLAYGMAFLVSILVSWPLIGVFLGFFTGKGTSWRKDLVQRRVLAAASWIWVGVFFGRLVVQAPLYFAGNVTALGIVKVVMGWPLFLGAAYFTYRLLAPTYRAMRASAD